MFRHPVYFVHHGLEKWLDLCVLEEPPSPDVYGKRLREGNDNWVLQTYLELKRRRLDVHLVARAVPDCICIAHYDDIVLKELPLSCYLVGIRGDRPKIAVSALNIVQNEHGLDPRRDIFMPHWSQPGLVARNRARGCSITTVGYMGMRFNLRHDLRSNEFLNQLQSLGVSLVVREYPFQDYSDIDVVLAVRPGTEYDINIKPATKLQNAWLAECPAILGSESAYRQYRRGILDYIEADSPQGVLEAIRCLKQNPGQYQAMVNNGRLRGAEFTHEAISRKWIELISGVITDGYERWLRQRGAGWLAYPTFALRATRHKFNRFRHMRSI